MSRTAPVKSAMVRMAGIDGRMVHAPEACLLLLYIQTIESPFEEDFPGVGPAISAENTFLSSSAHD
jgi:hypothetical protein